ncbi:MAG: TetR/AcrR family transcriptional regulator [Alphaproteobacteria bacterium]|nr:TetR/AcrR family transcriptional regulator [Alphaproteobacteria bacterium]
MSSRRELGKAERRRRIVDAAAALARATSVDAVSMVEIAERADVSPATLYNLFKTKDAILREVYDEDLAAYQRDVEAAPAANALDRIFVAMDLAAALYQREPVFYRNMARAGSPTLEMRAAIDEPRAAYWQSRVAAAVAEKRLRATADPEQLGAALAHLFRGAYLDWTAHVITALRMAAEQRYGAALMLLAFAAPAERAGLEARIDAAMKELRAAPRRAAAMN